jgi:hypothetical protein
MLWVVPVDGGKKMTELCTLTISPPDCRPVGGGVNVLRPRPHNGWRPAAGRDAPGPAARRPGSIAAHIRSSAWPTDRGRRSSDRRGGTRNQVGTEAKEARPRAGKAELLHGLAGRSRQERTPEGRLVRILPAQKRARSATIASSAAATVRICRASLGSGLVRAHFAADAAMAPGPPTKQAAPWLQSLKQVLTIKVNAQLSSGRVPPVEVGQGRCNE